MTHHLGLRRGPRATVHLLLLALVLLAAAAVALRFPAARMITGVAIGTAAAVHVGLLLIALVGAWSLRRLHVRRRRSALPSAGAQAPSVGHVIHAAAFYDAFVHVLTFGRATAFRERMLDLAAVSPGERVLDVGCGTGSLACAATQRVGAEGTVHGIDASPEMVQLARRKASRAGVAVTFAVAPAQALPFPDASFDVVTCTLVMHHLHADGRAHAMREIRRVLRPGGRLLMADLARAGGALAALNLIALVHGHDDMHALVEAEASMRAAGFSDVQAGRAGLGVVGYALGTREGAH